VLAWIGDGVEPVPELGVHVVEAAINEILANMPKRPLDLAFCPGSAALLALG
jgi:hypothetical protein